MRALAPLGQLIGASRRVSMKVRVNFVEQILLRVLRASACFLSIHGFQRILIVAPGFRPDSARNRSGNFNATHPSVGP